MRTITILALQSLLDVAIQQTGKIENVLQIAIENNRSITDELVNQDKLLITNETINSSKVLQYFDSKQLKIATAITLQDTVQMPTIGIGTMIIGNNFIVQ